MNMGFGRRAPFQGIVVAVLAIALVTSIKLFGEPVIGPSRFLLYTTAVLLSALIGGRNAGLVATFLGTLAIGYFFPIRHPSLFSQFGLTLQLALFFIEGCVVSLIVSSLDDSRFWLREGAVKSSALLTIARRSRDRARAETQRLAGLLELHNNTMKHAEPSRIIDSAVNLLVEHLGANYVEIYERSRSDSSVFVLKAGYGWRAGLIGHARLSAGPRTRAGLVLAGAESVLVEDLRVETRFDVDLILAEHDVFSGLTQPIVWNKRVVGLLGTHIAHRERFNRVQVEFARNVANVIGRVLANSPEGVEVG